MDFHSAASYYVEFAVILIVVAIVTPILATLSLLLAHNLSGSFSLNALTKQVRRKNILVTGGSKGLGLALSNLFALAGANVTILARNKKDIDTAVRSLSSISTGKIRGYSVDLTQEALVKSTLKDIIADHGSFDWVICNAGSASPGIFLIKIRVFSDTDYRCC
jgi:NADPH:quinone reductase-like Zn-dependent oxidoreductase